MTAGNGSAAPAALRLRALIRDAGAGASGARPAPDARERCGLCGLPVPDEHRHVLDLTRQQLHCACRACALLFDHSAAGGGHYRLIPDRCLRVQGLRLDDLDWRALGIPVEMAFFVRAGDTGEMRAFYPSPAGATRSEVPLDSWRAIEEANPALAAAEADVEAVLIHRAGGRTRAFVVGLDECYRLVGVVRRHWRGFSGGDRVWAELERFFAGLDARAGAVG